MDDQKMNYTRDAVAVVGLGYVGMVTAALLAEGGRRVVGVEVNPTKVADIRAGRTPVVEPGLASIVERVVREGRLAATTEVSDAVAGASVLFVCVGTPARPDGSIAMDAAIRVTHEIGRALSAAPGFRVIVFRSTMVPGTVESALLPILEAESGMKEGEGFGVCFMPEFLREGNAIDDFLHPSRTVLGCTREVTARAVRTVVDLPGVPVVECPIRVAEFVKYVDNLFHALKIAFANEVGVLAAAFGVDAAVANDIFLMDERLNISRRYLRPGFAFGGSCLPKDLSAMLAAARVRGLETPLLASLRPSNRLQVERGVARILAQGSRSVAMLGLAFKPGTDDLRESPYLEVAETLIGKGCNLRVFDRSIDLAALIGSNRAQLMARIPHIMDLMAAGPEEAVAGAGVVVLCHDSADYLAAVRGMRPEQALVDLAGLRARPETRARVVMLFEDEVVS